MWEGNAQGEARLACLLHFNNLHFPLMGSVVVMVEQMSSC